MLKKEHSIGMSLFPLQSLKLRYLLSLLSLISFLSNHIKKRDLKLWVKSQVSFTKMTSYFLRVIFLRFSQERDNQFHLAGRKQTVHFTESGTD